MKSRRLLSVLVLALAGAALVAGCSGLRLGYQQADVILGWRANTYFDLDREQRRDFSARLDRLLLWHRYEQLPEYAKFLTAAIDKAEHRGEIPGIVAPLLREVAKHAPIKFLIQNGSSLTGLLGGILG